MWGGACGGTPPLTPAPDGLPPTARMLSYQLCSILDEISLFSSVHLELFIIQMNVYPENAIDLPEQTLCIFTNAFLPIFYL